ncbi:hypothetical protein FRB97_008053 [Tulasnella sp. 331]|nr:hypothetical protein FRB97_008053 [Tulasnella sp. 331]
MFSIFFLLIFPSLSLVYGLTIPSPISTPIDGAHVPLASANAAITDPWQWWYFDLVSDTDLSSLQVVYFSGYGFGPIIPDQPYYAQLSGTFPNGTAFGSFWGVATDVGKVKNSPFLSLEGSNGVWPGIGGWTSTGIADHATYVATFTTPDISGQMTLLQTAPSHYPCNDPQGPGFTNNAEKQSLVGPGLGWGNALPSAKSWASFNIGGHPFTISGTGYHDTNFGDILTEASVATWYWGRGVVGGYTFVYFAYIPKGSNISPTSDPSTWFTAGYLARDGVRIMNHCSADQTPDQHQTDHITITTNGAVWQAGPSGPGTVTNKDKEGVQVVYHVGQESYAFSLTSQNVVIASDEISYDRWTASVTGGKVGDKATGAAGKGMFELFNLGP